MEGSKEQPEVTQAETVKTEQQLMSEFMDKYQQLCQEYQLRIVVNPAWKQSQDTGAWMTVMQFSIGKLPKEQ